METLIKSQKRVKDLGEVFTPRWLVNDMLSKLPAECWTDPTKTWIDPACGNGNFLVEVVSLRLFKYQQDVIQVLSTTYGIDIMEDNVKECRERILAIVGKLTDITQEYELIVNNNIICADTMKLYDQV